MCQNQNWSEKEIFARVKFFSNDSKVVSHRNYNGENILHDAAKFSNISVLKYFVSRVPPSIINIQRANGETSIFEVLIAFNVTAFDFLIEQSDIDLLTI